MAVPEFIFGAVTAPSFIFAVTVVRVAPSPPVIAKSLDVKLFPLTKLFTLPGVQLVPSYINKLFAAVGAVVDIPTPCNLLAFHKAAVLFTVIVASVLPTT